jgi:hypothetical protein
MKKVIPQNDKDDPLFSKELQPGVDFTQAQQARRDQIALAGRTKLTELSARLEAARPREVFPQSSRRHSLQLGLAY